MGVEDRIREAAASKGLSLKDFSDAIGISYRTVQNYVAGERTVGSEFLIAAAERLGVSSTWILTGLGASSVAEKHSNDDTQFALVTRFTVEASAGHGSLVQDETGSGTYAYNKAFLDRRGLKPDNLAVIAVKGDSMVPDLHDGDLILIDRAETQPETIKEGHIYAVNFDGDLFVKRIQRAPGKRLMLVSSNPVYQPVTVEEGQMDGVKIIGRVVNSTHEW